jgi:hypothetical protein
MTRATHKEKIEHAIPSTIHLAAGRSYDAPHEDWIWRPPRSTVVVVAEVRDDPELTVTHTISLLRVSGISENATA